MLTSGAISGLAQDIFGPCVDTPRATTEVSTGMLKVFMLLLHTLLLPPASEHTGRFFRSLAVSNCRLPPT